MVIGTVIRWGIPLSFIYCTTWQQDIWREGDEQLVAEQKLAWKKFFNMVDCGYATIAYKLNMTHGESKTFKRLNLVSKLESMDLSQCWNTKVMNAFAAIESATKSGTINLSEWSKSLGLTK